MVSYIDGVVDMVQRMLDAGTVHQVVVLLTDTDMKPVEKFTLEIGRCAKGTSGSRYRTDNYCDRPLGQAIIFCSCGFFLFFRHLFSAVRDWMTTILPHDVALVRI